MRLSLSDRRRFWLGIDRSSGECWLWKHATRPTGWYGVINTTYEGLQSTHRIAFFLANGYCPDLVRHTCDTPQCCRPDHLIEGDRQSNVADMVERERQARGEKNCNARLTVEIVRWLRSERKQGRSYYSIAKELGVHKDTVRDACVGRNWKHVS